jgi:phage tail sheath protein FI
MAVLALPEHFREEEALAYLGDLKSAEPAASGWTVASLGSGEAAAFSFAAIYHPWLIAREEIGGLLWMPPDGAAAGIIAARTLARGAWTAAANKAFTGVVSLTPRLSSERHFDFLLAQLNLVRQEPRGFLALSADTLSLEDELRPINVRRLLILLRREALRLGMTFVFEPNDSTLRRMVQGAFESIMQQLFTGGAFAGATAEASYRVVTDDTLNTPQDFDQGRFRVDLKVAPALPMSFLTVRLVQMGERATATEII